MKLTPILALALAVLAAGCGGDDGASATDADPTATQPSTTAATTTTTQETTTTPATTPEPASTTVSITLVGASPRGGIARPKVERGDRVVIVVRSDVADEVHLHGYDIAKPVAAGGSVRIPFRATIPGRFEVELEERHVLLAEITVS